MKKNGFTIAEVVVSIFIVILIGVSIATSCLIATNNSTKAKVLQFAVNEMQNMQKLFSSCNLVSEEIVDYSDLDEKINCFYNGNVETFAKDGNLTVRLCFNYDYVIGADLVNVIEMIFSCKENCVNMQGKVMQKDKELYNNLSIFKRWI